MDASEEGTQSPQIVVQDEPETYGSPCASPTEEKASEVNNEASSHHESSNSFASSSHAMSSAPTSPPSRPERQMTSSGRQSHRNSSFEYKETLDATAKHLEDGSRIINQYKLGKMIGKGAYGSVYRACLLDDPSVEFAVKEFGKTRLRKSKRQENMRRPDRGHPRKTGRQSLDPHLEEAKRDMAKLNVSGDDKEKNNGKIEDPLSLIRREIAILKKLHHLHVVRLYEVLDDPTKDELYMVFEFCPDGAVISVRLHEQVKPLEEDIAREYLRQIMLGIEYLHYHDIVHRDIKPDNILLQNDRKTCKIVDFGVSEFFIKPGDDTMQKSAGSPAFMSPELCKAHHKDFHGKDSDIWSLGVTFYCMVVGRLPFDKSHFLDLYESIKNDQPDYPSHLSEQCKDLLEKLLEKDSSKRITVSDMREHPFITNNGKESIVSVDENIQDVVEEVTAEELDTAINRIASVFTLARAISKFKRAGSRASSAGSLTEMTSNILAKGKEVAQQGSDSLRDAKESLKDKTSSSSKESSGQSSGSAEPTIEHYAEAHLMMGSSNHEWAAQHIARAIYQGVSKASKSGSGGKDESSEAKESSGKDGEGSDTEKDHPSSDKDEERKRRKEVTHFDAQADKDSKDGNGDKDVQKEQKDSKHLDLPKPKLLPDQPIVQSPVRDDIPPPKGASDSYKGKG